MAKLQFVQSTSLKKFHDISSIVRNASFSKGWLHLAVQSLFAVIIVSSFILIVLVATYHNASSRIDPAPKNRCFSQSCIVFCNQVPYFDDFEEDIVFTVSQLEHLCRGIFLALHNPMFHNGTLQSNWIPRLRLPILELGITGGNLHHFTPHSFVHQHTAPIRSLVLHNLVIKTWATESLVGLSHLEKLWIKNCTIVNVADNVLRSVQNTLESLTITDTKKWNPKNITGAPDLSSLTAVDFSNNIFNDILDKNSFTGLGHCRMLYLNSCNISSIGEGTFDHLRKIETLFLNDNNLVTIPSDLFSNILTLTDPIPRINLHDNNWHCDCSKNNIRELVTSDVLLTHPICKAPEIFAGKTFFEVVSYCNYSVPDQAQILSAQITPKLQIQTSDISSFIYINNGCYNENTTTRGVMQLLSPIDNHRCQLSHSKREQHHIMSVLKNVHPIISKSNWIKFSFFINVDNYSMIQISPNQVNSFGILWYQSTCPNEVYCLDIVPGPFKIFNIDNNADYVFCPVATLTGTIANESCVTYSLKRMLQQNIQNKLQILIFVSTGIVCLVLGAICVYGLVRTHPCLLRGSKRILFVKHKTVDALVLPPKVSVRDDLENEVPPEIHAKNIFTVPANPFTNRKFYRNISVRSSKSNAPSYISAFQPSEDQLAEWRIRNHFTNEITSELSINSWIFNADTYHYIDVIDTDTTYESLK